MNCGCTGVQARPNKLPCTKCSEFQFPAPRIRGLVGNSHPKSARRTRGNDQPVSTSRASALFVPNRHRICLSTAAETIPVCAVAVRGAMVHRNGFGELLAINDFHDSSCAALAASDLRFLCREFPKSLAAQRPFHQQQHEV